MRLRSPQKSRHFAVRVVLDTNILVSGLLWDGGPRRILLSARNGAIELFISPPLVDELRDVLARPKFAVRLAAAATSVVTLVNGLLALATLVQPTEIPPTVELDPDDDAVLACAIAASAVFIVSGDDHLLSLGTFRGIRIVKATELLFYLDETGA